MHLLLRLRGDMSVVAEPENLSFDLDSQPKRLSADLAGHAARPSFDLIGESNKFSLDFDGQQPYAAERVTSLAPAHSDPDAPSAIAF